uniref:Uncharacterized protein n=1 Tax=Amphimedon queenslandica TaxID=400682 RepID=A0A1X7VBS1_AMPQE
MKLVVSVIFLLIFFAFDDVVAEKCSKTPLTIRKDFISNCRDLNLGLIHCLVAWFAFKGAFSGRDPATVVSKHYHAAILYVTLHSSQGRSFSILVWDLPIACYTRIQFCLLHALVV